MLKTLLATGNTVNDTARPGAPSASYQRFIHRLCASRQPVSPYSSARSSVPVSHAAEALLEFRKQGLNCVPESLAIEKPVACFKITHQLVSIPFSSMFELSVSGATRGHPFKLAYPDSRINVLANSFPVRVIALRNRLPDYVVMASRLTTFKRLLRTVNMSYAILGKS